MPQIRKGIKYAVVLAIILSLIPALLSVIDMLQTTRHGYSDFEPKSKVIHDVAQLVGCNGLPGILIGGCQHNPLLLYTTFLTLWLISSVILYKKSEKLFTSSSDRYKFIIAFIITFPIALCIFAWGMSYIVFIVAVFKFGFV